MWGRGGGCGGSEVCLSCATFSQVYLPSKVTLIKVLVCRALVYKLLPHVKPRVGKSGTAAILVLVEIELIFCVVAGMLLCFGFRRAIMVITH